MLFHFNRGILIFIISTSLFKIAHSCSRKRPRCHAVHGRWSKWSPDPVNHCSCSGKALQERRCTNPSPSCGGKPCSGSSTRYVDCNECSCNNGGCEQICRETDEGHSCSCILGYKKSGSSCIEILCATEDWKTPGNGVKKPQQDCSDGQTVKVNTICRVECNYGYELQGPSTAVCTPQGNWNPGSPPTCTVKKCGPVVLPNRGHVTPSSCKTGPSHGVTCYFSCLNDFEVDNTQASCDNGVWSTSPAFSCVDRKKPDFTSECPSDQSVIADEGKTDKIVYWSAITAADNDGEAPDMDVTPVEISPTATSHKFSEGTHVVTFTARDKSGNSRSCSFRVEVKASSSPQEMRQRISLQFPLRQTCRTKEQFMEIATTFREAFLQAIRPLPEYECFESDLCSIGDVKVSGCEQFTEGRKKRAVGSDTITTIECTVIFRASKKNASAPSAAEKAGSVAFQLQYVVSMGQFTMNISENVFLAREGSLQHLSSEFTCGLGFFTDIGNSSCVGSPSGFFLDTSTKHCRECEIGSYQDTEGQVTCQSCPSGYTTKSRNSDSVDDCYRVKAIEDEDPQCGVNNCCVLCTVRPKRRTKTYNKELGRVSYPFPPINYAQAQAEAEAQTKSQAQS